MPTTVASGWNSAGTRPRAWPEPPSTLPPHQSLDLTHDLAPHRLAPNARPPMAMATTRIGRESEEGVVREGGAQPGHIVVPPAAERQNDYERSHSNASSSSLGAVS